MSIIYTELLRNIGLVTVSVTLPSDCNGSTRLEISADRQWLSVSHNGESSSTQLPCQVSENGLLRVPVYPIKELSYRVPVDRYNPSFSKRQIAHKEDCPWPASSLTTDTQIGCRKCLTILSRDSVEKWKALPGGNWAEMMEFWHCHKPDDEEPHERHVHTENKGYAASNRLGPTAGTAIVDINSFILLRDDCVDIESTRVTSPLGFACASCHGPLGVAEEEGREVRLYKWNLCLRVGKNAAWQTLQMQTVICAQLSELIESQATHRFLAYSGRIEDAKEALLLWVITPDMIYSAPANLRDPKRAMKTLYQIVSDPSEVLEQEGMKIDELQLPSYVLPVLLASLERSTDIMPTPAKKLHEWNVGLLER